jgi:hypothetical protein
MSQTDSTYSIYLRSKGHQLRFVWAKMGENGENQKSSKMLITYNVFGVNLTTQKTKELFELKPHFSRYGYRFTAILFRNEPMTISRRIWL